MVRYQRLTRTFIFATTSLALYSTPAGAGAWLQKRGAHYFKVSAAYLYSEHEFNGAGDKSSIRSGDPGISGTSYRDLSFSAYVEYGVSDRLTLLGSVPFKVLTSRRTEQAGTATPSRRIEVVNGGLADMTLGVRYPIFSGKTPVSIQGEARLPLGYDSSPVDEGAPLGSGKTDFHALVLSGASLYPLPAYVNASAGYRFRSGSLADEYTFSLEGGVSVGRVHARAVLDALYSAGDPDASLNREGTNSSAVTGVTNQDLIKISPAIEYSLTDGIRLSAEVFHILSGKNTVAGTAYSAGLVFQ